MSILFFERENHWRRDPVYISTAKARGLERFRDQSDISLRARLRSPHSTISRLFLRLRYFSNFYRQMYNIDFRGRVSRRYSPLINPTDRWNAYEIWKKKKWLPFSLSEILSSVGQFFFFPSARCESIFFLNVASLVSNRKDLRIERLTRDSKQWRIMNSRMEMYSPLGSNCLNYWMDGSINNRARIRVWLRRIRNDGNNLGV